jgi:hypothetical protein
MGKYFCTAVSSLLIQVFIHPGHPPLTSYSIPVVSNPTWVIWLASSQNFVINYFKLNEGFKDVKRWLLSVPTRSVKTKMPNIFLLKAFYENLRVVPKFPVANKGRVVCFDIMLWHKGLCIATGYLKSVKIVLVN